jgi:hypothetical protein
LPEHGQDYISPSLDYSCGMTSNATMKTKEFGILEDGKEDGKVID